MALNRSLVVVGASAGGIEALRSLLAPLPRPFPGAILVVLHTTKNSNLVIVLKRYTRLEVSYAADGEEIPVGQIRVAPPDHHLLIHQKYLLLSKGPRQNGLRPAIDPLFESAAREYGKKVVAVLLSGTSDDGCVGIEMVKRTGGLTIVQKPNEATWPELPQNALATKCVDHALPVSEIAAMLAARVQGRFTRPKTRPPAELSIDFHRAETGVTDPKKLPSGIVTTLTCPECGGTLWQRQVGNLLRFKCHTGHSYSPQSLLEANGERVEQAMWFAIRVLKERSTLLRKLARQSARSGRSESHQGFVKRAEEIEKQADSLREILLGSEPLKKDP